MIRVTVNGVSTECRAGLPLPDLLVQLGLENQPLVIERNRTALLKNEWSSIQLCNADEIEFIRVVAGG